MGWKDHNGLVTYKYRRSHCEGRESYHGCDIELRLDPDRGAEAAHGEFCVSRFSARRARLNGRYRENRPCVTSVSYGSIAVVRPAPATGFLPSEAVGQSASVSDNWWPIGDHREHQFKEASLALPRLFRCRVDARHYAPAHPRRNWRRVHSRYLPNADPLLARFGQHRTRDRNDRARVVRLPRTR